MKVIVFVCVLILGIQAAHEEEAKAKWVEFKATYNKNYRSALEERVRFNIFQNNLKEIEEHNKLYKEGKVTYYKGVNHFTDMTKEEFLAYVGKYQFKKIKPTNVFKPQGVTAADVDWRNNGLVTAVKNQGQCGSCWSFSATGSLEGQYARSKGQLTSFSEQNLVDCSSSYGNAGCSGGLMDYAFEYIRDNGIETESQYPYEAVDGSCRQTGYTTKLSSWSDIPQSESSLQNAVSQVGPISVAIEATGNLQSYAGGIFVDNSCSNQLNHGVLAVGYGSEGGQDYWIVKNSWSSAWGENGYVRMARNLGNMCGIASSASYPIV